MPAPPIPIETDPAVRAAYAEGAGMFRIIPAAVAQPQDRDALSAVVRWAQEAGVPLVPRGSGSGMGGGNVGAGVVLDLTAGFDGPVAISGDTAVVGAGVLYRSLAERAAASGLRLPPEPSSRNFCTLGGMVACNAAGARSFAYGPIRPWVRGLEVVWADGTAGWVRRGERGRWPFEADLRALVERHERQIRERFPRTRKSSSGYALDRYLDSGDLVDVLIGSEGTLAIVTAVELALDTIPHHRATVVVALPRLRDLGPAVAALAALRPSALELLDRTFLAIAASPPDPSVIGYSPPDPHVIGPSSPDPRIIGSSPPDPRTIGASSPDPRMIEASSPDPRMIGASSPDPRMIGASSPDPRIIGASPPDPLSLRERGNAGGPVLPPETAAVLIAEFEGATAAAVGGAVAEAARRGAAFDAQVLKGVTPEAERALWALRHAASPALARLPETRRSLQVVEDGCVPLPALGDYVAGLHEAAVRHRVEVVLFGHAGDGHVHVNALVDLTDEGWVTRLRALFSDVTTLVARLGGTLSGEHGDGRLRAGSLEVIFGPELCALFRAIKGRFDPSGILNPGVIVPDGADPFDHLKVGPDAPPMPEAVVAALRAIEREGRWDRSKLEIARAAMRGG